MASMVKVPSGASDLTGPAKLEEVTRILGRLKDDLEQICLLPHQRDKLLEQLKIYGRDPADADPIFTEEGIKTLTRHAFNSPSYSTSRNALRCIANAMLLQPKTRQIFVDLHYEAKACDRLKHDNRDDEFLVSRILFLTTYDTNIDIEALIDQHHVAETIDQNLSRHAKLYEQKKKKKAKEDPMEDMALTETLKVLFNLTHFCPQRSKNFTPAIAPIFTMLQKHQVVADKPLEAPISSLVNALINMDYEDNEEVVQAIFSKGDHRNSNVERLIELLDLALRSYKEEDMEKEVSPLITLIRKIFGIAPRDVKSFMRNLLLPNDDDRKQPLGRAETMSSRLLRLSTSPVAPTAREEVSSLLFEMSDKDAKSFVQNVGYGFASGFLFQHNVPIPENAMEAWSTGSTDDARSSSSSSKRPAINPITGQTLDSEPKYQGPEMTKEEKEREAERLFILFERLKANGVISAENPLRTAQEEGRFEELSSDAESE